MDTIKLISNRIKNISKNSTIKYIIILLSIICIILLSIYVIMLVGKRFFLFRLLGLNIEELYSHLNDNKITNNSKLTFTIESNDCTLLGKYAGPDYRLIESTGSNKNCADFVYKTGDDPNEFNELLIDKDIMEDSKL